MTQFVIFFLMMGILIVTVVLVRAEKRKQKVKRAEEKKFESKRKELLRIIYEKGKKVDKIVGIPTRLMKILEEMNILPKELKTIYESLQKDDLAHVEADTIYLTDLGEAYIDIFMNRKLK